MRWVVFNWASREEKDVVVPLPEAKHPDQPTDSRISFISRETMELAKKEVVVESKVGFRYCLR